MFRHPIYFRVVCETKKPCWTKFNSVFFQIEVKGSLKDGLFLRVNLPF